MKTAQVQVLHSILTANGWVHPGPATMEVDEARKQEARGFVDVLSVDGKVEVWSPCCDGGHAHP